MVIAISAELQGSNKKEHMSASWPPNGIFPIFCTCKSIILKVIQGSWDVTKHHYEVFHLCSVEMEPYFWMGSFLISFQIFLGSHSNDWLLYWGPWSSGQNSHIYQQIALGLYSKQTAFQRKLLALQNGSLFPLFKNILFITLLWWYAKLPNVWLKVS